MRSETMNPAARVNPTDFIDEARLEAALARPVPDRHRLADLLQKSLAKQPLALEETGELLQVRDPEGVESILESARALKRAVYGDRIVLFAPLYVGNRCINDCVYCGFRRSNREAVRRTLTAEELRREVLALVRVGHKRLILVFGEHPAYGPEEIAAAVRTVYDTREGSDEIRRVNINAAPQDHEGFRIVKEAGIGTWQIFHETYHHDTYARLHPIRTRKHDYLWRLHGPSRAYEAGCDDVGIGALFGLYDWRFETLGLVRHAEYLRETYGVGPHTISFPRLRPAAGADPAVVGGLPATGGGAIGPGGTGTERSLLGGVDDASFAQIIAILRLAVPYTGLILTARESQEQRRRLVALGVSQIDAGSRIELGGYQEAPEPAGEDWPGGAGTGAAAGEPECGEGPDDVQDATREQFMLADLRSLDRVARELAEDGYTPSFCTACYRLGRTGEQFMEYAIPGFIERFCTPNALLTLQEYLIDHASPAMREAGERRIAEELNRLADGSRKREIMERLRRVKEDGERDLLF